MGSLKPITVEGDGITGQMFKKRYLDITGLAGKVISNCTFTECGQVQSKGAHHITFNQCSFLYLRNDNEKQFQLWPENDDWIFDGCVADFMGDFIYSNYMKNDTADGAQRMTVKNCYGRDIGTHLDHPSRDGHFVGLQGGSGHKIINNMGYNTGTQIEFWRRKNMPMRDCLVEGNQVYLCRALANEDGSGIKFSGETGGAKGLTTGNACRNNRIDTCDGWGISSNWPDEISGLASNAMVTCKKGNLRVTGL